MTTHPTRDGFPRSVTYNIGRRSGATDGCRSVIAASARALLQLVDLLGGFGFGEVLVDLFAGFVGERLQVGRLRAGHALVASDPLVGILLRRVVGLGIVGVLIGHEELLLG